MTLEPNTFRISNFPKQIEMRPIWEMLTPSNSPAVQNAPALDHKLGQFAPAATLVSLLKDRLLWTVTLLISLITD